MRFRYPSASTRIAAQDLRHIDVVSQILDSGFWGVSAASLIAQNVVTPSPIVSSAAIGQIHSLAGESATCGIPIVATATISQVVSLGANSLLSTPPIVQVGAIAQAHILSALFVLASSEVGESGIGQAHNIVAVPVETTVIALASSIGQIQELLGESIVTGLPIALEVVLAQIHHVQSNDVLASAGQLEQPTLKEISNSIPLEALNLSLGQPIVIGALLNQICALLADHIQTEAPLIHEPELSQVQQFVVKTTILTILVGTSDLGQRHELEATDILLAPFISRSVLGGTIALGAVNLAVMPYIGLPRLIQAIAIAKKRKRAVWDNGPLPKVANGLWKMGKRRGL